MEIVFVIVAMVIVGLIIGWVAGLIWKENRPIGVAGDYAVAVITTVVVGLLDYFIIPRMNFSRSIMWLGVAFEPAGCALIVLWLIRRAKR